MCYQHVSSNWIPSSELTQSFRRTSKINQNTFDECQRLISVTILDLRSLLQNVDERLTSHCAQDISGAAIDSALRDQIREQRDCCLKCLNICDDLSSNMAKLESELVDRAVARDSRSGEADNINIAAKSACRAAANSMAECKTYLQSHADKLGSDHERCCGSSNVTAKPPHAEGLIQLQEACNEGLRFVHSAQERINTFENISSGDGSYQLITSIDDLIFAKGVSTGDGSIQAFGQYSPENLHMLLTRLNAGTRRYTAHGQEISMRRFEKRRGTERNRRLGGYRKS
jgi:Fungal N-terminal domain of STAND proteins